MKLGRRYIKVSERRIRYLKIHDVSTRLGISQRTIRYYEQLGLLPAAKRTLGQMRLFSEEDVTLLERIKKLQKEHKLSLKAIKTKISEERDKVSSSRDKHRLKVVVDSTSSLPANLIQSLDIEVIPFHVQIGKSGFSDGETLTMDSFKHHVSTGRLPATTAPPSFAEFMTFYNNIYERGAEKILSIHISSGLSDCVLNARKAAKAMSHLLTIEVLDAGSMGLGSGLIAIRAAESLAQGQDFAKVLKQAKADLKNVREFFSANPKNFWHTFYKLPPFGDILLDFNPVFTMDKGQPRLLSRTGTSEEALGIFQANLPPSYNLAGVVFGETEQKAHRLSQALTNIKPGSQPIITEISTVPCCYFGPDIQGIATL